jgi:hypothetical protein
MTLSMAKRSSASTISPALIWTLSPVLLGACFAVTPAGAAGFLDFDQGWTGANVCIDPSDVGCVDHVQPTSVNLIGFDTVDSQLTYVSPTVPSMEPGYANFSFSYAFNPIPNQTAFYTFAGIKVPLDSTGGLTSAVYLTGVLGPGQSMGFGVANSSNAFPAELILTDFSYAPVPGPLPFVGLGVAYGWKRQLRAVQRNRRATSPMRRAD